ncbi:MAG: hypothetical protein K2X37_13545, partial [Chitinophagaceae bacterium]|nr:hypothetical protein [Chitinophagaceae bacterium]
NSITLVTSISGPGHKNTSLTAIKKPALQMKGGFRKTYYFIKWCRGRNQNKLKNPYKSMTLHFNKTQVPSLIPSKLNAAPDLLYF